MRTFLMSSLTTREVKKKAGLLLTELGEPHDKGHKGAAWCLFSLVSPAKFCLWFSQIS